MSGAIRNAAHLADPFAAYRRLRTADPVHWNGAARAWALTRHEDVLAALRQPCLSSRRPAWHPVGASDRSIAAEIVQASVASWLIRLDTPEHTSVRTPLTRAISASMTAERRRRLKEAVGRLLDRAPRDGNIDAVAQFAAPLAATVIMDLIGVDADERKPFLRRAEALAAFISDPSDGDAAEYARRALAATESYVIDLIAERRRCPRDDVITVLVHERTTGSTLTTSQISGLCALLLLAGYEPTAYALAHAVYHLIGNPSFAEEVRDTRRFREATDELLRYDTPIQGVMRTATADVRLGTRVIRQGQTVIPWLGAANRDPGQHPEPDTLDLSRPRRQHLAFGAGIHHCPGAPLARMTIETALRALLLDAPQLELASSAVEWHGNAMFRHLSSLPLRISQGDASWTA
jgi:cytochrome P450